MLSGFKTSGQGSAVVLLHSSLSSSSQWQALVKRLEPYHYCINIDLFGYGDGPVVSQPDDYDLNTEAQRVQDIINAQIGDAPFIIIGHSFGGAISLLLAYLIGERLLSMVLYEPVAFHLLDNDCEAFKEIDEVAAKLPGKSSEQGAQLFVDYWNFSGFFASMPAKVQLSFSDKMAKVMLDFRALMGQRYAIKDCQLSGCSALVIEGKDSRLSAKTLVRQLAQQLPNAEHQVFAGGHMAPVSQSEAVAKVIANFLLS